MWAHGAPIFRGEGAPREEINGAKIAVNSARSGESEHERGGEWEKQL